MIPEAASHPQADNRRTMKGDAEGTQVFYRKHDIVGPISRDSGRCHIIITKKLLRLLQLNHHNIRIRRCSQEINAAVQRTSRRSGCHGCTMSDIIGNRHQLQRIIQLKRFIDLLPCIFTSINKAIRRCAGLHTLVPDGQYSCASVLPSENRIPVIYSRIRKSKDNIPARQIQRLLLYEGNPAAYQRLWIEIPVQRFRHKQIHQSIQPGDISVKITGNLQRRQHRPAVINGQKPFINRDIAENIIISLHAAFRKNKIVNQIHVVL